MKFKFHKKLARVQTPCCRASGLVALALVTLGPKDTAAAEIKYLQQQTVAGCQFDWPDEKIEAFPHMTFVITTEWSGRCLDGKISGFGELTRRTVVTSKDFSSSSATRIRSHAYAGRLLGFGLSTIPSEGSRPDITIGWVFSDGVRILNFRGFGLEGYSDLLKNQREFLPLRVSGLPANKRIANQEDSDFQISDGDEILSLSGNSCEASDFPECIGPDGLQRFRVFYFEQGKPWDGVNVADLKSRRRRYCPAPRDFSSCIPLIESLTAQIVKTINSRINAFFDQVEAGPESLRVALHDYAKRAKQ